jgi:lipoprotein-releasing system ATP-binding protein
MSMIEINELSKEYRGESDTVEVLSGLNFMVQKGEIVSVEGASGEGKSTLLNIIGTIDSATSGRILIDDVNITDMTEREKEKFRSRSLGFIFQHHYLLPDFTVLENVTMPLLILRRPISVAQKEAEDILAKVGLHHRLDHYPSQISGGEMARAGVARALVGGKTLILADEPTGNLDRKNSDKLADLIWSLQSDFKFTLMIVTHDQELAARVPTRYRLKQGSLQKI